MQYTEHLLYYATASYRSLENPNTATKLIKTGAGFDQNIKDPCDFIIRSKMKPLYSAFQPNLK